jgi:hypothetical protein
VFWCEDDKEVGVWQTPVKTKANPISKAHNQHAESQ